MSLCMGVCATSRYRLIFDNQSDDAHPVHLYWNSFELTNLYGKLTAGIMKDVVLLKGFRKIEADFVPSIEGLMRLCPQTPGCPQCRSSAHKFTSAAVGDPVQGGQWAQIRTPSLSRG